MASRKKPIIERVNNLLKSSGDATKSQSNHLAVSLTPGPRSTQHQRRLKVRPFVIGSIGKSQCRLQLQNHSFELLEL